MQPILTLLHNLDRLYCSDTLAEYEQCWQETAKQVQLTYPGFTIAYAEIYTAGAQRVQQGGMRHVLLSRAERSDR